MYILYTWIYLFYGNSHVSHSVLRCVAVCCSVLQCVAMCVTIYSMEIHIYSIFIYVIYLSMSYYSSYIHLCHITAHIFVYVILQLHPTLNLLRADFIYTLYTWIYLFYGNSYISHIYLCHVHKKVSFYLPCRFSQLGMEIHIHCIFIYVIFIGKVVFICLVGSVNLVWKFIYIAYLSMSYS